MDEYEVDKPPAFTTKKLIVIGFCLGNIIMMIVYAAMSYTIAWRFLYEYESFAPHQVDDAKVTNITNDLLNQIDWSIDQTLIGTFCFSLILYQIRRSSSLHWFHYQS